MLGELGLVEIDAAGVRAVAGAERRELDASPLYRAARERLAQEEEFLGRALTLDLTARVTVAV